MKRKLILTVLVVAVLVGFGALLHSPPSIIDAVTGATPKSKRSAQAKSKLKGSYVFCINTDILEDDVFREELKDIVSGASDIISANAGSKLTLYVSKTDQPLIRYAENLCSRLNALNVETDMKTFSSTMLYSRAMSGDYEIILASEDLIDVSKLKTADHVTLDSEEMG